MSWVEVDNVRAFFTQPQMYLQYCGSNRMLGKAIATWAVHSSPVEVEVEVEAEDGLSSS